MDIAVVGCNALRIEPIQPDAGAIAESNASAVNKTKKIKETADDADLRR